jgi:hypothetical protein
LSRAHGADEYSKRRVIADVESDVSSPARLGGGVAGVLVVAFPAMSPELPFTIIRQPERVLITIHRDAGSHEGLITQQSYTWIHDIKGTVELDFSQLNTVNSLLVAWLFHLVQAGRLSSLVVRKANSFIINQLKQFYLDRFVTITYDG